MLKYDIAGTRPNTVQYKYCGPQCGGIVVCLLWFLFGATAVELWEQRANYIHWSGWAVRWWRSGDTEVTGGRTLDRTAVIVVSLWSLCHCGANEVIGWRHCGATAVLR